MSRLDYRRIGNAILNPNGCGIGSPRVAGLYAQDPECDTECDRLCELANAGARLIRLCRDLDFELGGVTLPATTSAVVNDIRSVLADIDSD